MTKDNSNFVSYPETKPVFLTYQPWWSSGIKHGFSLAVEPKELLAHVPECQELLLLKQTHSSIIYDARTIENVSNWANMSKQGQQPEADAVITNRDSSQHHYLIAIKTADCLPLIIKSEWQVALVHAGWRGLASHIITQTLGSMLAVDNQSSYEILIGPCAGVNMYAVGQEVIQALGATARYQTKSDGKLYLDLVATAEAEILQLIPTAKITSTGICTMTDLRFNSYRRQGEAAQRNLSFLVL